MTTIVRSGTQHASSLIEEFMLAAIAPSRTSIERGCLR